jgi:hypothetical protein
LTCDDLQPGICWVNTAVCHGLLLLLLVVMLLLLLLFGWAMITAAAAAAAGTAWTNPVASWAS